MAAALYGAFLGVTFIALIRLVPQPAGAIIFWSFSSIQLSWGALTVWRRTGLPFTTAALITGAITSMSLVALAVMGQPFPDLTPASWILFGSAALGGPLFLLIESRVNKAKWQAWTQYMKQRSAWDIATGRHIPQLRDAGPQGERHVP